MGVEAQLEVKDHAQVSRLVLPFKLDSIDVKALFVTFRAEELPYRIQSCEQHHHRLRWAEFKASLPYPVRNPVEGPLDAEDRVDFICEAACEAIVLDKDTIQVAVFLLMATTIYELAIRSLDLAICVLRSGLFRGIKDAEDRQQTINVTVPCHGTQYASLGNPSLQKPSH